MAFFGQTGTFLCFQTRRSSVTHSLTFDLTVVQVITNSRKRTLFSFCCASIVPEEQLSERACKNNYCNFTNFRCVKISVACVRFHLNFGVRGGWVLP